MSFFNNAEETSQVHLKSGQSMTLYFNIATPSTAQIEGIPVASSVPVWTSAGTGVTIAVQAGGFSAIITANTTFGQEDVSATAQVGEEVFNQTWAVIEGDLSVP